MIMLLSRIWNPSHSRMERVHCPSTTVTIATSTLTPLENSSSVILREMPALLDVRLLLIPTVAGELTEEERSKKNPTKVKRSAAYACPWMAKSIVLTGLCKSALVQLSYSIGVAKPLSLFMKTYGTEKAGLTAAAITDIVKLEFDCRPGALAHDLRLREPKYNRTAAYCHFGRDCVEEVGKKFFSWEEPVDLSKYADMDDAGVAQAVADNKEAILKK